MKVPHSIIGNTQTDKDMADLRISTNDKAPIDVKILSRLLGHADVNITYNIYVHLYGDGFDEMYSALLSEK